MGAAASIDGEGGAPGEERYVIEGVNYAVDPAPGGRVAVEDASDDQSPTKASIKPKASSVQQHSDANIASPAVNSAYGTGAVNAAAVTTSQTAIVPKNNSSKATPIPVQEPEEADGDDINPLDILFQFIPYYGQGDPSNDSIVRSTLSGLAVEDIDKKDEYGNTLLLVACQYRCEDLARIILNKGADPNALNSSGACCLHFTCYRESASRSLAKILLQNGANPEVAETSYGCTPLHYCAGTGDVDFCKMLISYGANVSTYDLYNYTCVDYAREAGMTACAQYLQSKLLDSAAAGNSFRTGSARGMQYMKVGASGYGAAPANAFAGGSHNASYGQMSSYGNANVYTLPRGASFNSKPGPIVTEGDWQVQVDAQSGQKYYTHMGTGECLWEKEYRAKKDGEDKYLLLGEETPGLKYTDSFAEPKAGAGDSKGQPKEDAQKKTDAARPPGTAMARPTTAMGGGQQGMDPAILQSMLNEAKLQSQQQLEAERNENRALISTKDGKIAKLEAVVETLVRENEKLEVCPYSSLSSHL
jgi:ankyrin repeat protein